MSFNGTLIGSPTFSTTGYFTGSLSISLTGNVFQGIALPSTPVGPLDAPVGQGFTFECFFHLP